MKTLLLLLILFQTFTYADLKISGYLPDYRNLDIKKAEMLDSLIFFSLKPEKDGTFQVAPSIEKILSKAGSIKNCKKIICIGGWGKSEHFKTFTSSKESRLHFIDKLAAFLKKYDLQGVDYDWEHPKNKDEEKAYELLIAETAARGIDVSIAVAAWQKFTPQVFKNISTVNLMSYDNPKEHSTLADAEKDVQSLVKLGCPPEKIRLGIPFYGRHIENRKAVSFNKMIITNQSTDVVDGYYFNNVETLQKKVELAKKLKLGGLMIWEIEQDDYNCTLLKALHKHSKP